MNRRSFFGRLAALAAASATPSVMRAADLTPIESLTDTTNEIHRQQSAGPSLVGMSLDQLVEELKGDHPIELQHTVVRDRAVTVEFIALRTCCYKPPAWLNVEPCAMVFGDTLTLVIDLPAHGSFA